MTPTPDDKHWPDQLISNPKETYGELFQEHLLEQYKLYVDSSQKVSEKRISTGNYLLTVNSSLLTVFGIASTLHIGGAWLVIVPIAGLLVSLTWFSLVISYKDLNTAKFKVIHELEDYLPAALFRCEWHSCEQGQGKAYKPITHLERWIPVTFAAVYLVLAGYALFFRPPVKKAETQPVSVTGTVDVNIKSPAPVPAAPAPSPAAPTQPRKRSR
jgi:hypothetical protein